MRHKTFFWGGVVPRNNKQKTINLSSRNAEIPRTVFIPFQGNGQDQALALVKVGDKVKEGQAIASNGAKPPVLVHASIPGVVKDIRQAKLFDGTVSWGVELEFEGDFTLTGTSVSTRDWHSTNPERLIDIIREMGVIGMGGEGVPTYEKLLKATAKKTGRLIVNAMESEPYRTSDARILAEKPQEILQGIEILAKILGFPAIKVAINESFLDSTKGFRDLFHRRQDIQIHYLHDTYPQGDERLLIQSLFARDLPTDDNVINHNFVIFNVSTVFAIYEAVVLSRPLIDRLVTITGSAIQTPSNLKVRIGTPLSAILEDCGGLKFVPDRIVVGGLMRGTSTRDLDLPITAEIGFVMAMAKEEIHDAPVSDCTRCGKCVRSCPVGLEPIRLLRLAQHGQLEQARKEGLMECSACGICSYVCPAHIPLGNVIMRSKANALEKGEPVELK